MTRMTSCFCRARAVAALLFWVCPAAAQTTTPAAVVQALRQGGLVVVMRHASSPSATPTREQANPDNTTLERQLDQAGRDGARVMGQALRDLKVPIGPVFISPTYRARETAKYAELPNPQPTMELTDSGGLGMQGVPEASVEWLRRKMAEAPARGNTVLITHNPNLARVFPEFGNAMAQGEAAVMRPDGKGGAALVTRLTIEQWATLAR